MKPKLELYDYEYQAVKKIICPYCEYNIPEYREAGAWVHTLAGLNYICKASGFRDHTENKGIRPTYEELRCK